MNGASAQIAQTSESTARAAAMLLGAVLLILANAVHAPVWYPTSFILMTASFIAFIAGTLKVPLWLQRNADRALTLVAVFAIALQLGWLVTTPPEWAHPGRSQEIRFHGFSFLAVAVSTVGTLLVLGRLRARIWIGFIVASSAAISIAIVLWTPNPWLDVHTFHLHAFDAIRTGHSPYGGSIENVYRGLPFYSDQVLSPDKRRVLVGYPYPPLQLMLAEATQLIFGNYRFLHAMALPVSAALLFFARPGKGAAAAATICALLQPVLHMLTGAWTDPVLLLFFSLAMFTALRAPRLLPYALGLCFADKQYAVLLAPFAFFLLPEPRSRKQIAVAAAKVIAVGIIVTAPFALANLSGFVNDVLLFQVRQPFRSDSLSYPAAFYLLTHIALPSWIGFAAWAIGVYLCLRFAPRTKQGFACSAALALGFFFVFNKQSFPNYLSFVIVAGLWAAALADPPTVRTAADPLALSQALALAKKPAASGDLDTGTTTTPLHPS